MPQYTIAHSGSCCFAFSKHFTPSSKLNPKHQFRPRLNQRCASDEAVDTRLVCVPRLNRSMTALAAREAIEFQNHTEQNYRPAAVVAHHKDRWCLDRLWLRL